MDALAMDRTSRQCGKWAIWILLGSVLAFRLVYLAVVPFDLIHDEAYYWDWSRHLDWCYYSKPPGIAWLIALSTRATAANAFFVRLPAAILSTITAYLAFCLGQRLYDRRAGFFAAALVCATPGNAAAGVMMTIDSPFLCCWSLALYCFWRMLERGNNRLLWTVMTTLAVGIGLLFKQTMLAFPVLAGSFVVLSQSDRIELKRWSFWCCGVTALAFLSPVLWWNSQHDWITFVHTRGHFAAETISWTRRLSLGGEFLAGQLGLLSPTTYLMLACTALLGVRQWTVISRTERYLIWFWVGPLVAITLLSFSRRIEANWPAPFYSSGVVLLAALATRGLPIKLPSWTLRRSLTVGVISVAVIYALPFLVIATNAKGSPIDIAARMWGWQELAIEVDKKLAALPDSGDALLVVAADRGVTAELAFYLPNQPHLHLWDANHRVDSQYDIWGWPQDAVGREAILITSEPLVPRGLAARFQGIESLGGVTVEIGHSRSHQLRLWRATSLDGETAAARVAAVPTSPLNADGT